MPNSPSSTASTITAMRRCRQNSTNWSIIEQDSALDHDLFTGLESGADGDGGAFLELRFHDAALEGPRRSGDKHCRAVIVHEERGARHQNLAVRRPLNTHVREHVRLEGVVGVGEGDTRLVAPRIGLE